MDYPEVDKTSTTAVVGPTIDPRIHTPFDGVEIKDAADGAARRWCRESYMEDVSICRGDILSFFVFAIFWRNEGIEDVRHAGRKGCECLRW